MVYIVAIEEAPSAHLISRDNLGVEIGRHKTLRLRLQNHTGSKRMAVRFTTSTDATWDEAKSRSFEVTSNDTGFRAYRVDMLQVPGWTGTLKQLRLDLATGSPATGNLPHRLSLDRRFKAMKQGFLLSPPKKWMASPQPATNERSS